MRVALLECDGCKMFLDYSVVPVATTRADARKQARLAGWRCGRDSDLCARCRAAGRTARVTP